MTSAVEAFAERALAVLRALAEREATMIWALAEREVAMLRAVQEESAVMPRVVQLDREVALQALAEREARTSAGRLPRCRSRGARLRDLRDGRRGARPGFARAA